MDHVDSLHADNIDIYAIVSSDSDFPALVTRIRTTENQLHGYGQNMACSEFVNSCSKFVCFDHYISKPTSILTKHSTCLTHEDSTTKSIVPFLL
ncbi:NYN domain-containing protein [Thalassotalea fonticola]|uniref:NYN domain-containing protein n=1 Tax=Thalassotalea fonticola TaxID=3065649 RepID=UPI00387062E2